MIAAVKSAVLAGRGVRLAGLARRAVPRRGALLVFVLATLLALPFLWLVAQAVRAGGDTTLGLATVAGSFGVTLLVAAATLALTCVAGVGCAWLCVMCRFPGAGVMRVALALPLAMPPYLLAYIYSSALEEAGLGLFRGVTGTVLSLSMANYPYVFLFATAAFLSQPCHLYSTARVLGLTPWQTFLRVSVPVARPAIMAGLALVLMETIGDFGVAERFGLPTLSVAVYDVWQNRGDFGGASQLALVTMLVVLALVFVEQGARARHKHYAGTNRSFCCDRSYHLGGGRAALALGACSGLLLVSFVVPFLALARMSLRAGEAAWRQALLDGFANSLLLALAVSAAALGLGVLLAAAARMERGRRSRARALFAKLSLTGYAFPGTILALAVMGACFGLAEQLRAAAGLDIRGALATSIAMVCVGLTVKFVIITYTAGESGLKRIPPSMPASARLAGLGSLQTLLRVHIPLLRPALLAALMLVFVDVVKELPVTLLLRPLGFDTLSTYVFQYASDEELLRAAPSGLLIVLLGLPAMVVLRHLMNQGWRATGVAASAPKQG